MFDTSAVVWRQMMRHVFNEVDKLTAEVNAAEEEEREQRRREMRAEMEQTRKEKERKKQEGIHQKSISLTSMKVVQDLNADVMEVVQVDLATVRQPSSEGAPPTASREVPAPAPAEQTGQARGQQKVPTPAGQQKVPTPAHQKVPAPAQQAVQAPVQQKVPTPAQQKIATPAQPAPPAPARQAVPAPAKPAAPAPAVRRDTSKRPRPDALLRGSGASGLSLSTAFKQKTVAELPPKEAPPKGGGKRQRVAKQTPPAPAGTHFEGMNVYLLRYGNITSVKIGTLSLRLSEGSGSMAEDYNAETVTHILLDKNCSDWVKALGKVGWKDGDPPIIADIEWLHNCIKAKERIPVDDYVMSVAEALAAIAEAAALKQQKEAAAAKQKEVKMGPAAFMTSALACQMKPTKEDLIRIQSNKKVADILQEMSSFFASVKERNSEFRKITYARAATTIEKLPFVLTSVDQIKDIKGMGGKMRHCIDEILRTGTLELLKETRKELEPMKQLSRVWGIGPVEARKLFHSGIRSIEDLRREVARGRTILTRQQNIGLRYVEDLEKRMPRQEASELIETVIRAAKVLEPGVESVGMGSFRRGKETCGDVDILIMPPPGKEYCEHLMKPLLAALRQQGFLVEDLTGLDDKKKHHTKLEAGARCASYMGICRLPGAGRLHRRIDIKMYPRSQCAFAMLYFTGSDWFNRSMRWKALKMGYSLSDHGLIRCGRDLKGKITWRGEGTICLTEAEVFEALGLEYRSPTERSCDAPPITDDGVVFDDDQSDHTDEPDDEE